MEVFVYSSSSGLKHSIINIGISNNKTTFILHFFILQSSSNNNKRMFILDTFVVVNNYYTTTTRLTISTVVYYNSSELFTKIERLMHRVASCRRTKMVLFNDVVYEISS